MDHFPSSNIFKIPYYASSSKAFTVEIGGSVIRQFDEWDLLLGSPASIVMKTTNNSIRALDTQKVKISYFVDLTSFNVMESKSAALNEIKIMCSCPDNRCSLTEIKNIEDKVADYACVYPDPDPITPPSSQIVYLSAKAVPVRYFDNKGAPQKVITGNTTPQEGRPFSYIKNDLLVPNNMPSSTVTDPYVGFNEIYGSLTYSINGAQPALEVNVSVGKTYDIYTDR
jgi:hypothetical protein